MLPLYVNIELVEGERASLMSLMLSSILHRFEFDSVVPGDIRYDFSINTGKSIFKVERPPVYSDDIFDGTRA